MIFLVRVKFSPQKFLFNVQKYGRPETMNFDIPPLSFTVISLLHLICVIARAYSSTRATSLMRVKISTPYSVYNTY